MRIGLKTVPQQTTWLALKQTWSAADENLVFDSAWVSDHLSALNADPADPCLEAWTTLAALSQTTTRLRLGVLVSGIVYRHPAVVAKMIATIDHLCDGRLEIGLGTGWHEPECQMYGFELGSPQDRADRLDEALTVINSLLTQQVTSFDGRFYSLRDAVAEPKPVQSPRPPLVVGGSGERRTLPTVARFAEHWNFPGGSVAEFAVKRRALIAQCLEIGRDFTSITTSTHVSFHRDQPVEIFVETLREHADAGLDLAIIRLDPPHGAEAVEAIARGVELSGVTERSSPATDLLR